MALGVGFLSWTRMAHMCGCIYVAPWPEDAFTASETHSTIDSSPCMHCHATLERFVLPCLCFSPRLSCINFLLVQDVQDGGAFPCPRVTSDMVLLLVLVTDLRYSCRILAFCWTRVGMAFCSCLVLLWLKYICLILAQGALVSFFFLAFALASFILV
ncbi:hypothetical protein V8C44DRAFT_54590 [Trichoderma aethiopicum]